jgi:hypothetical protein
VAVPLAGQRRRLGVEDRNDKPKHESKKGHKMNENENTIEATFNPVPLRDTLRKISLGQAEGETFDLKGEVWNGHNAPLVLVSLLSHNFRLDGLDCRLVEQTINAWLAEKPVGRFALGLYAFTANDGSRWVSLDFNAVVHKDYLEQAKRFAKANGQRAIWDVERCESIPTGGDGAAQLVTVKQAVLAGWSLSSGRDISVSFLVRYGNTTFERLNTVLRYSLEDLGRRYKNGFLPDSLAVLFSARWQSDPARLSCVNFSDGEFHVGYHEKPWPGCRGCKALYNVITNKVTVE